MSITSSISLNIFYREFLVGFKQTAQIYNSGSAKKQFKADHEITAIEKKMPFGQ